jgi:hypothetical protein
MQQICEKISLVNTFPYASHLVHDPSQEPRGQIFAEERASDGGYNDYFGAQNRIRGVKWRRVSNEK